MTRAPDMSETQCRVRVRPESRDYPEALRRCLQDGRPLAVTTWGKLGLLDGELLGFFCSVRAPGDALLKTYDLARVALSEQAAYCSAARRPWSMLAM